MYRCKALRRASQSSATQLPVYLESPRFHCRHAYTRYASSSARTIGATGNKFTQRPTVPCILNNKPFANLTKQYALNDPHTGKLLYNVDCVQPEQAIQAVEKAAEAYTKVWENYSPLGRRAILLRAAVILKSRKEDFVKISVTETTSTAEYAGFDHFLTVQNLEETAAVITSLKGEIAISEHGKRGYIDRVPFGVVFGIAPWNAPLYLGSRSFVNAIAAGNTVVMKTSEYAPKIHTFLAEILTEAGLPEGVLNVLHIAPEDSPAVCEAIIAHRAVGKLNFTGSSFVGSKLGELCGKHIKPACMELGGKAPFIVLEDADVAAAAQCAAFGGYVNSGQICMSTDSLIVHDKVADQFLMELKKHLSSKTAGAEGHACRGVFSTRSAERIDGLIQDALSKGARVAAGEHRVEGNVVQPIVVEGITPDMQLYEEEIFGPATTLNRFKTDEEALQLANATEYGLAAAIYSSNESRAHALARKVHAGMVHINGPSVHDVQTYPHGGFGKSGYGRFNGIEGLREFTQTRVITINPIREQRLP